MNKTAIQGALTKYSVCTAVSDHIRMRLWPLWQLPVEGND